MTPALRVFFHGAPAELGTPAEVTQQIAYTHERIAFAAYEAARTSNDVPTANTSAAIQHAVDELGAAISTGQSSAAGPWGWVSAGTRVGDDAVPRPRVDWQARLHIGHQLLRRVRRAKAACQRLALLRVGERREAQPPKAREALLLDAVRPARGQQHMSLRRQALHDVPLDRIALGATLVDLARSLHREQPRLLDLAP
mgnify:CR=1 FL=1